MTTRRRTLGGAGWLAALALASCTGGGDGVISGVGNSSNLIGEPSVLERAARQFAALEATPRVSDQEIVEAWSAIRARALEGEAEAALVLTRVAVYQREAEEHDSD